MNITAKTIGWIAIFSIAMAALEGAVVVYLRALYYPGEFTVNFKIIDRHILLVEITREAATLIMLLAVGYIAGKNFKERFAYFLLSFAIWDIFYYAWLKFFIDWPSSFFDWDILFLIPIVWIGPVAAPLICSCTMICLAIFILRFRLSISRTTWTCLIIGAILILFTFTRDYANLIIANDLTKDYLNIMENHHFLKKAIAFVPKPYDWNIFWVGELMFVIGIGNLLMNRRIQTEVLHSA